MSALALAAPEISPVVRAALVERIPSTIQETTARSVAAAEAANWVAFAEWSRAPGRSDDVWSQRYVDLVSAAQVNVFGASSSLYADYVALSSGRPAATPVIEARDPRLVSLDDAWTASAPKRLGKNLAAGMEWPAAVDNAGRYAASLASLDVAWMQRGALDDVSRINSGRVRGQRKVPGGGSCGWCRVVADRLYGIDSNIPTHAYDRCGVAPVVADDDFQPGQLAGRSSEIIGQPAIPSTTQLETERFAVIERALAA